ncbi:MAG: hypothetical protein ACYTHJ_17495 [Planctomycetota bacterium]|jgi:hypothetical protein
MRTVRQSTPLFFIAAGLFFTALGVQEVHAFPPIRSDFFNAYPEAVGTRLDNLPGNSTHCGVCHYAFGGGGDRNPYGTAIENLPEITPEQILTLGDVDSDGDGFTNGEEILEFIAYSNTPTFPGLQPDNIDLVSGVNLEDIENHLVPVPVGQEAIPAVSDWGMTILVLLTLSGGSIIWRRAIV